MDTRNITNIRGSEVPYPCGSANELSLRATSVSLLSPQSKPLFHIIPNYGSQEKYTVQVII